MRVLFLTQVLPYPLDAGPKTRAYYVLRHLAAAGHQITLCSFVREDDRPEHIRHLATICESVHTVLMRRSIARDFWHLIRSRLGKVPFLIRRDRRPAMAALLRKITAGRPHFDLIHANQLSMAPYAILAKKNAPSGSSPRMLLDQYDAVADVVRRLVRLEHNGLRRLFLMSEQRRLASFEQQTCQRFDHVVWVNASDRAKTEDPNLAATRVTANSSRRRSTVIPICIDPRERPMVQRRTEARRVTFVGGLHWPPNAAGIVWFARDVWPHVHAAVPDAVLTVIGKHPPPLLLGSDARPALRRPAGSRGHPTLPATPAHIEITGYVTDLTPFLVQTAAFIVPLQAGGGMRVKILDAWSWGLPVVSTTIGAEGLHASNGENLLIADSAAGFADAVRRVLTDRKLADRLSRTGRATVETHYDWRSAYAAWDRVYREVAGDAALVKRPSSTAAG